MAAACVPRGQGPGEDLLPVILVFFLAQKQFSKGITVTGLKG